MHSVLEIYMADYLNQKSKNTTLNRKTKRKPKALGALGESIRFFLAYGIAGTIFAILPNPKTPSILFLSITWGFALIVSICKFWNSQKPNWWIESFYIISPPVLFLGIAIHGIGYSLSGWFWLVPLVGTFLIALFLPAIDLPLAKIIHNEQFAPQTRLGKGCMRVGLGLLGISGVLGTQFGLHAARLYGQSTIMLFLGIFSSIIAILLAQTYAYQVWVKRPWQQKKIDGQIIKISDSP
jgi:hypothetical protein